MNNKGTTSSVSFFGLLQLAFIVLKLCKVITWSWAAVLIPLWISLGLTVIIFVIAIILSFIK